MLSTQIFGKPHVGQTKSWHSSTQSCLNSFIEHLLCFDLLASTLMISTKATTRTPKRIITQATNF